MKKQWLLLILAFCTALTSFGQAPAYQLKDILNVSVGFPQDIVVDERGTMYVLDLLTGVVLKMDANGHYIKQIDLTQNNPFHGSFFSLDRDNNGNFYALNYSLGIVEKFSPDGTLLLKFGSMGTGETQFQYPSGLALDKKGNIYIADTENHCVKVFDAAGQFIKRIGTAGTSAGQFMAPADVCTDADGNVYVVDSQNYTVQKFSPAGNLLLNFGSKGSADGQFRKPTTIGVDAKGNIYVGDPDNLGILRFNPAGGYIDKLGRNGLGNFFDGSLISFFFDAVGNLYAADPRHHSDSRINKFDASGQYVASFGTWGGKIGQFFNPVGVAVDAIGNFYVADAGNFRIQKFNARGQFLFMFQSPAQQKGEYEDTRGITLDPAGNVYTLQYGGSVARVNKFNASGQFITKYEIPNYADRIFTGIAADAEGTIYISSFYECCVRRLSAAGVELPKIGTRGTESGQIYLPLGVAVDLVGNVYVTDINGHRLQKFSPDGRFLLEFGTFNRLEGSFDTKAGIAVDGVGNVYSAPGVNEQVQVYNSLGQPVTKIKLYSQRIAVNKDGTKLVALAGQAEVDLFSSTTDTPSDKSSNLIMGRIFQDNNQDCKADKEEPGIPGMVIEARPGPYYAVSDEKGNYSLAVDTGSYTIRQLLPQGRGRVVTQTCPIAPFTWSAVCKTPSDSVRGKDFADQITLQPYLSVEVGSTGRRMCFGNTTSIQYCNSGGRAADEVKVYLELPQYVVLTSATLPYVLDKDKHYVFSIGRLEANQCSTLQIRDSVICNKPSIRGLTQCTKVWITPANPLTVSPNWDKSDVVLKAKCLDNGRVRLGMYNTGAGAMSDSSAYRIYLDARLVLSRNFKLKAGDSLVVQIPANGQTVRLEADQRPNHPTKQVVNLTLEACGTNAQGKVSLGYVDQLPADDADPEVAVQCLPITASFDPNDKRVAPAGVSSQHTTPLGQELEYTIRFQNTGNDYAYKVVITDTLSDKLDLSTLRMSGASHPMQFSVSGKGRAVLNWTFDNINLPDSSHNQAGSHGFVSFVVKPIVGLPENTRLENAADIYFDYNAPVRTNLVFNTLALLPTTVTQESVVITVCKPNLPVTAGANQSFCEQDTARLQAQNPLFGQGHWKVLSGKGVIRQSNDPHALVSLLGYGNTVLEWSIPNGSCPTDSLRASLTLTRYQSPPVPVVSLVGINELESNLEGRNYVWFCNNIALPDHTRRITVYRGGSYTLQITSENCASQRSEPYVFKLNQAALERLTSVYPNPAGKDFTVELPAGIGETNIGLYDALGRKLQEQNSPGQELTKQLFDVSACRAGIYLIKIQTQETTIVKRVVLK